MCVFGGGRDDALGVEHVGDDAFFEEFFGGDIGHRVAESALSDFAGWIVNEYDCGCVFGECVDGVDFFWAVDGVRDWRDEVATRKGDQCDERCEDGDWFDHVWVVIL